MLGPEAGRDGTPPEPTASGEAPRPAASDGVPLDPRMVRVWTVMAVIASLPVLALVAAIDLGSAVAGAGLPGPTGGLTVLVLLVCIALVVRYPRAAYARWRYLVGSHELELRHGVVFQTHSVLPYYRVQHIDITQGPVDRMMKLSRLVVHTASAGSDSVIPGISSDRAEELRRTILSRTGPGDAV